MEETPSAAYERTHPGVSICEVEGTWHAWLPSDGDFGGEETYAWSEAELLAKLPA